MIGNAHANGWQWCQYFRERWMPGNDHGEWARPKMLGYLASRLAQIGRYLIQLIWFPQKNSNRFGVVAAFDHVQPFNALNIVNRCGQPINCISRESN